MGLMRTWRVLAAGAVVAVFLCGNVGLSEWSLESHIREALITAEERFKNGEDDWEQYQTNLEVFTEKLEEARRTGDWVWVPDVINGPTPNRPKPPKPQQPQPNSAPPSGAREPPKPEKVDYPVKVPANHALNSPTAATLPQIREFASELRELVQIQFSVIEGIIKATIPKDVQNGESLGKLLQTQGLRESDIAAFLAAMNDRDADAVAKLTKSHSIEPALRESLILKTVLSDLRHAVYDLDKRGLTAAIGCFIRHVRSSSRFSEDAKDIMQKLLDSIEKGAAMLATLDAAQSLAQEHEWPENSNSVPTLFSRKLDIGRVLILPGNHLVAGVGSSQKHAWVADATPHEAFTALLPTISGSGNKTILLSPPSKDAVQIVNPADNGIAVDYFLDGKEYRLRAKEQKMHPVASIGSDETMASPAADLRFKVSRAGKDKTIKLERGNTFAFRYDTESGCWSVDKVACTYAMTIDNSRNPLEFRFALNGKNQTVPGFKTMTWTHVEPMSIDFDSGGSITRVIQTNDGTYRRDDGKSILCETKYFVAIDDSYRWVLVPDGAKSVKQPQNPVEQLLARAESIRPVSPTPTRREESPPRDPNMTPKPPSSPGGNQPLPNLYLLAVGVSKFKNPQHNLQFAKEDAVAFVEVWRSQEGKVYGRVECKLFIDEEATRENILQGFQWLEDNVTDTDVAILMFSTHGVLDKRDRFYLATHELNPDRLTATCIEKSSVDNHFTDLCSKLTLAFLDACHSGAAGTGKRLRGGRNEWFGNRTMVLSSSMSGEESSEDARWGHGAFTKAFLDAIEDRRKSDLNGNGELSLSELRGAIQRGVKELTGERQTVAVFQSGVNEEICVYKYD